MNDPLKVSGPVANPERTGSGHFDIPAGCDTYMSPDCIRQLYNIPKGTKNDSSNRMGIFQNLGEHYAQYDLDVFFWAYTDALPFPLRLIHLLFPVVNGSYCNFTAFGETGNCETRDCHDPDYSNPNSSDGYQGALNCGTGAEVDLPAAYQQRQCAEIMKLGLQGSTILISAGDEGVAGFASYTDPSGCLGPNEDVFNPQFLATCPPRSRRNSLSYQNATVASCLAAANLSFTGYDGGGTNYRTAKSGVGRFNRLGRAYPDVSANGDNLVIASNGGLDVVGGTSVSAPLWGSVIKLLNEERIAVNKTPVGFVHPVLYAHPEVFNDITMGDNKACKHLGFEAAIGWDPVSGLG
ncbi:peptidase S8/S53 domain-containing protein [Xylariaceae sp. FL0255]|nr:peptidase S8/S53 domain-containing protein [Xylariaceae sp. FL0255]